MKSNDNILGNSINWDFLLNNSKFGRWTFLYPFRGDSFKWFVFLKLLIWQFKKAIPVLVGRWHCVWYWMEPEGALWMRPQKGTLKVKPVGSCPLASAEFACLEECVCRTFLQGWWGCIVSSILLQVSFHHVFINSWGTFPHAWCME